MTGERAATPGAGNRREWFLPEPVYVAPGSDVALTRDQLLAAARIKAVLAARNATRFKAYLTGEVRAGPLPVGPGERSTTIETVFDWLAEGYRRAERRLLIELQLSSGRSLLLDLDRDLPARGVSLTKPQFGALQDLLGAADLPRDLYYPLSQRCVLIEPIAHEDGRVSTIRQTYSPLQWRRSGESPEKGLVVPTDREWRAAFLASCEAFLDELHFRELITLQRGGGRSLVTCRRSVISRCMWRA